MVIPELQVGLDRSGKVVLSVRERETPAQALVAECMILANYAAALFLKERNVPALYRTQKPGRMTGEGQDSMSLAARMRLRHAFNRTIVDTAPRKHAGLGLDCYCSISSPMRKYLDLVVQRQLVAAVRGDRPVYNRARLRAITAELQPVLTRASMVESERRRYWLLKKMEPLRGQLLRAIVLSKRKKTYTVLLADYLIELNTRLAGNCCYDPGCELQVILSEVDPFYGSIGVCLPDADT
jgi:exoribonuclease-2